MNIKTWLTIGFISLILSACASQANKEAESQSKDLSKNPHFVINGDRLASRLELQELLSRYAGDLRVVQAQLKNTWHASIALQYRIIWKTADGFTVDTEASAWTPKTLVAGESFSINATAPEANASQFMIYLNAQ